MSWEVGQRNGEPYMPINLGGDEIEATRDNLWLYTFSPQYAEIDHAYLIMDKEHKKRMRRVGYYMFRGAVPEFDQFVEILDENYFWHVRGPKPSDTDIEQYAKYEAKQEDRPEWLQ